MSVENGIKCIVRLACCEIQVLWPFKCIETQNLKWAVASPVVNIPRRKNPTAIRCFHVNFKNNMFAKNAVGPLSVDFKMVAGGPQGPPETTGSCWFESEVTSSCILETCSSFLRPSEVQCSLKLCLEGSSFEPTRYKSGWEGLDNS